MAEVELTRISSKGQIVIPQNVREELHIKPGDIFAAAAKEDTVVLKKVALPSAKEVFEKIHKWGTSFTRRKGIKEEDSQAMIKRSRQK